MTETLIVTVHAEDGTPINLKVSKEIWDYAEYHNAMTEDGMTPLALEEWQAMRARREEEDRTQRAIMEELG